MKKIILLSLFVAIAATVKPQADLPYKSLSSFNNDTVAYLIYNFEKRADFYKGKTINEVLKELRIPVVYYKYKYTPRSPQNHLRLYFNSDTGVASKSSYYMYISSNTAYLEYVPWAGEWSAKIYEPLKSIKVEAVGVSVPRNSEYHKERERKRLKAKEEEKPSIEIIDTPVFHKWDQDMMKDFE